MKFQHNKTLCADNMKFKLTPCNDRDGKGPLANGARKPDWSAPRQLAVARVPGDSSPCRSAKRHHMTEAVERQRAEKFPLLLPLGRARAARAGYDAR
jgi:hypothetical protein